MILKSVSVKKSIFDIFPCDVFEISCKYCIRFLFVVSSGYLWPGYCGQVDDSTEFQNDFETSNITNKVIQEDQVSVARLQ